MGNETSAIVFGEDGWRRGATISVRSSVVIVAEESKLPGFVTVYHAWAIKPMLVFLAKVVGVVNQRRS